MDVSNVKEIVETIKTLNLNINSETGRLAIETVAQKAQLYLLLVLLKDFLTNAMIVGGLVTGVIAFYKIVKAGIDQGTFRDSLNKLDLEEQEHRKVYERIMKSVFKE